MPHPSLEPLLSPEGWAHASADPVDASDPGRFHALFGRDSLILALQVLPRAPGDRRGDPARARRATGCGRGPGDRGAARAGSCTRTGRWPPTGWSSAAGRCATARCATSAPRTRRRGSWCVLDATGDAGARRRSWHRPAAPPPSGWSGPWHAGGGLVRCGPRRFPGGLGQQGWRDALDPADRRARRRHRARGRHARPRRRSPMPTPRPSAVAALDALVRLDPERAEHWAELATRLRAPDRGGVPARRDGPRGRRPPRARRRLPARLAALGRRPLRPTRRRRSAERLTRPDVLTAYGVRTLASTHPAFLAEGYHRGAVWPFDSLAVLGRPPRGGVRRGGRAGPRRRTTGGGGAGPPPRALRRHAGGRAPGRSRSPTGCRPGRSAR